MLRLVLDEAFLFESENRCSFSETRDELDHGLSKEGCNLGFEKALNERIKGKASPPHFKRSPPRRYGLFWMRQEGPGLTVFSREGPEKASIYMDFYREGPEEAPTYIGFYRECPEKAPTYMGFYREGPEKAPSSTEKAPRRPRQAQRRPREGPDLHWFLQGRPRSLRLGFTKVNEGGLRLN